MRIAILLGVMLLGTSMLGFVAYAESLDNAEQARSTPPSRVQLSEEHLQGFIDLGRQLSLRRDWLQGPALDALRDRGVTLPQLFEGVPAALRIQGQWFWLRLELMSGPGLAGQRKAEDRSPLIVYLSHEIYDTPGRGAALGFREGELVTVLEEDLSAAYAVALTLERVDFSVREMLSKQAANAPETDLSRIALGSVRHRQLAAAKAMLGKPEEPGQALGGLPKACQEDPGCNGPTIVSCSSSDFVPFFMMNRVRINEDHEPWTQGQPEIDLFPLVSSPQSGAGGDLNIQSQYVFKGQNVTDAAGQTRYLPDINSANTWYSLTDTALFPLGAGRSHAAMLVEDDGGEGLLRMDHDTSVAVQFFDQDGDLLLEQSQDLDRFLAISPAGSLQDAISTATPGGDDLFDDAIGITDEMGCFARGMTVTFDTDDWSLRGKFLCLDTDCTPAPPPCKQTGTLCGFNSECCSRTCASLGFAGLRICA